MSRTGKIATILMQPLLLLCLLGSVPVVCAAENLRVLVVLSDNTLPYQTFYKTLSLKLPASIKLIVQEHPEDSRAAAQQADLIVAVGMKATELVAAKTDIPLLGAMLPKAGYEELLARQRHAKGISAIYLNQPWSRQLDFLKAAFPDRHRIGLLYSPDTRIDLVRLRQDIAARDGSLIAQPVRSAENIFTSLEDVLAGCDVLLALPDSMIYSSSNIRNILLTSYRRNVPLIGLSQAYVNAGALAAIFSTPEQIAEQTSDAVIAFARTAQLAEPQYPTNFTVAVNQQVARSLGIELRSTEAIRKQMLEEKGRGQ